jgi:hypothetical protein
MGRAKILTNSLGRANRNWKARIQLWRSRDRGQALMFPTGGHEAEPQSSPRAVKSSSSQPK